MNLLKKIMNVFNFRIIIIVLAFAIIIPFFVYAFDHYIYRYAYSGKQLVSSEKAKQNIKNNQYDVILDVRTTLEYNIGHYPNSVHIPSSSITKHRVEKYIPNKNASILVYCNTGQRARYASELLDKLGYNNVQYISGRYNSLL
jgi:rhodanese-related sulfurtransferase